MQSILLPKWPVSWGILTPPPPIFIPAVKIYFKRALTAKIHLMDGNSVENSSGNF
jgi:hypothetical protein